MSRSMMDLDDFGLSNHERYKSDYLHDGPGEDGMGFGDNFPKIALGLKGHHTISHDKATGHWEDWGRLDRWYAKQFAYFIDKNEKNRGMPTVPC